MDGDQLEKRLARIETRLTAIEQQLNIVPLPIASPVDALFIEPSILSIAIEEKKPGNWLGWMAIICFVLAAGFIVKLSLDSGWLTPDRQIGVAVLLGISLVGAGFALMDTDRAYASLLPASGIIIFYLTAFAAYRLYTLVSFGGAITLVGLVSALCVWLYIQLRQDIYAIMAAIGAYSSPLILHLNVEEEFSLYYFLLCSIAFAFISIGVKSRILTIISAYLAILMSATVGLGLHQELFVAAIIGIQFLAFVGATYIYARYNHSPLTREEVWAFLPVLLIFYAVEYSFISHVQPAAAPWISLGFAGVLACIYMFAQGHFEKKLESSLLVINFITLAGFHSFYLELLPAFMHPWLLSFIMGFVAFSPFKLSIPKSNSAFFIPFLAIGAVTVIEYITIITHLFMKGDAFWLSTGGFAFISLWCAIIRAPFLGKYVHGLFGVVHLLAVIGLYQLTVGAGSLAVSVAWLCYAVCVMALAFAKKDEVLAKSALLVLAFAAGKALLYDAASAPTTVRILCLLLTGGALYGCGLLMRKISSWNIKAAE